MGDWTKKARPYRQVGWQRPIFPWGCPQSIIGAERLNYRVRDGYGCFPFAIVTTPPACTGGRSVFLPHRNATRNSDQAIHTRCSEKFGGDEGIRTPDLCRAKAALFQLSYIPPGSGWAFLDSNQGPQSYQDCALTTGAKSPYARKQLS